MDYENFKERFVEDLKDKLYEKGIEADVSVNTVNKLNDSYEAVTIKPVDDQVGVNISLNKCYGAYEDGTDYNEVVDKTSQLVADSLENKPEVDMATLTDYDKMKDKLVMEVVSAETNKDLLETVPHKDIEDMAVVYRFVIGDSQAGVGTILVNNQMLDNYGITAQQLHEDAIRNAPEIRPLVIEGMAEVLAKQMGVEDLEMLGLNIPPEQEQRFVASVEGNVHGAGVIAYQNFMDEAAERAGGSFFILPSSIHEVLIIPDNGKFDTASLEQMVREVNATTVELSDQLTDSVYHYDADTKVFELAEKFDERAATKEADISKADKAKEVTKPHRDRGGEAI